MVWARETAGGGGGANGPPQACGRGVRRSSPSCQVQNRPRPFLLPHGEPTPAPAVEVATRRRNTPMNEDRLTGNAKNFGGQVEEGFGRATGDVKTQLQGKAKQAEGALQDVHGQAKDAAATAADAIPETPAEAHDFLRTTIDQRPHTTAAVALAIGDLIGRFGRRANY